MSIYTFHRENGFYPLELASDEEARANAECNPGTVKVVNEITGETVWPNTDYTEPVRLSDSVSSHKPAS